MKTYPVQQIAPYTGLQVTFESETYEWNGRTWFETKSHGIPPLRISAKLTSVAREQMLTKNT